MEWQGKVDQVAGDAEGIKKRIEGLGFGGANHRTLRAGGFSVEFLQVDGKAAGELERWEEAGSGQGGKGELLV